MPPKATFFNLKCDATFELAEGDRNSIYYNDFGTLVVLGGYGNLNGRTEIWDVANKKMIATLMAPDTTHLEWSPNGEVFVTATTAPRLRVGNCFKVWHYTGALLHETMWTPGQELYEVIWQRFPVGVFTAQSVAPCQKIEGIKSSQAIASNVPYRPPGARGVMSSKTPEQATPPSAKIVNGKRRKNVQKLLDDIKTLKLSLEAGNTLKQTQLEKINREEALLKELQSLAISIPVKANKKSPVEAATVAPAAAAVKH